MHLGYQRTKRGAGTWGVRLHAGQQTYHVERLGLADDVQDTDNIGVLTFQQAQAEARERAAAAARKASGIDDEPTHRTVKDAALARRDARAEGQTVARAGAPPSTSVVATKPGLATCGGI